MRLIALALATLLLLIQYPLWLGKGGWLRVWELDRQVTQVQSHNDGLKERNSKLESEVEDLKTGTGAVEERARFELGMIKKDEIFVQILDAGTASLPSAPPAASATPKH
ncbi:cell division protein FtsB [Undibacterium terreum]|uniref:Cell division protein FtsB n=1 Tax=Undibacterium terreum TaxID=1224302 RepID=A0A916V260_9BURK|nr:cell division protein FtsB [Undibacterium terreum]GGC99494.1 cell division protein FtsB [Undibacterium terreum]